MKSVLLASAVISGMLPSGWLAQAVAQEDAQPVKSALVNCLGDPLPTFPLASDPKTIPPGLIEGQNVNVTPLPRTNGYGYSYVGTLPRVKTCGIAIYGRVSPSLQTEIRQLIDISPKWRPYSPDDWKFDHVPAIESYWGDPLAPSMVGVVMLTRQPSPNAPTLEVEFHIVLLQ